MKNHGLEFVRKSKDGRTKPGYTTYMMFAFLLGAFLFLIGNAHHL